MCRISQLIAERHDIAMRFTLGNCLDIALNADITHEPYSEVSGFREGGMTTEVV
jgi:hypothetical protein